MRDLSYDSWVAKYDTIRAKDREAILAHLAALPSGPLISVVLSVGDPIEEALGDSIASVVAQLNPGWELLIVVDELAVVPAQRLIGPAASDTRVRVAAPQPLQSPEAAINAAVQAASGEFIAFLRGGDILPEHSLYEVLVTILEAPLVDIVYTDCDQIDDLGARSNPWFKPGWDPDLLLAQHYISGLVVYRRTFLQEVGGLRVGFEGASMYDLALRATAATTPDRIVHLPAILHRKRLWSHSNPECPERNGPEVNPATGKAKTENQSQGMPGSAGARRAVREHLDSRGYEDAVIESVPAVPNVRRIIWPLRSRPLVSVIVPTRDRVELLSRCVAGVLRRTDYTNLELLIIDNGSVEAATLQLFERLVAEDKRVRILRLPGPFNYSALNNAAAREAQGEVLLLLNNDIDVINPDWLREMVSHAVRPDVGIVGAKLLYADSRIQHAGVVFAPGGQMHHLYARAAKSETGYRDQLVLVRSLSAVTAACAAIRRSVFWEVRGLNEADLAIAFNDIDLCLRLGDYGYRVVWTPFAELFHLESASRGLEDNPEKMARFRGEWNYMRRTWGLLLDGADPFHNPNLLLAGSHIEIPCQPRREKPWRWFAR